MDDIKVSISLPTDDNEMIGRECFECENYFKLKPGTGLDTNHCHCPYCDFHGGSDKFWTNAQIDYAKSIVLKEAYRTVIKPTLDKSFKQLERSTRNSLIQIKVTSNSHVSLPIKYYSEDELETLLQCDKCGLEFAIYGVFSKCPDCKELNAFLIYEKSLEVTRKQLEILTKPEIPNDIKANSLSSVLSSCVSAFDGLGKELRKRNPEKYPVKPRNLFQNLFLLNKKLKNYIGQEHSNLRKLLKLFQVRHIIEHNMGVIDADFVKILPEYSNLKGRKYKIEESEIFEFLTLMRELGLVIRNHFENHK